ncbi:hypothetical protein D3C75_1098370 [compost metagenome]
MELLAVSGAEGHGRRSGDGTDPDCDDTCALQLLCRRAADCHCGLLSGRIHDQCGDCQRAEYVF